jgi:hypothetical protein
LIDSSLAEPEWKNLFPYYGDNWENARININLFLTSFGNSKLVPRVRTLKTELEKPKEEVVEVEQSPEAELENNDSGLSCVDLENKPEVRGGLANFIASIGSFDTSIDELIYNLTINQRGVVEEFELLTSVGDENLKGAFNEAVEYNLTFNPVLINGEAVKIQCDFTFPLN